MQELPPTFHRDTADHQSPLPANLHTLMWNAKGNGHATAHNPVGKVKALAVAFLPAGRAGWYLSYSQRSTPIGTPTLIVPLIPILIPKQSLCVSQKLSV